MDGIEYVPIRATLIKRIMTLAIDKSELCQLGCNDWRIHIPILRNFMIKHGTNNLAQAHSMQFIAQKTSIPVPKVYCAFSRKGKDYILMRRMPGTILAKDWYSRSSESKAMIIQQLKDVVAQMRAIVPSVDGRVENVSGGPLYDCRLPAQNLHGPFASVQDFHRYLRSGYNGEHPEATQHNELVRMHDKYWATCFTHGDLSSLNILAKGDKLTGIVDWETAGWYPTYWEYVTAWNVNVYNIFWRKHIGEFLDPLPSELEMEKLRNYLYGYDWFFVEDDSYKRLEPQDSQRNTP